MQEVKLDLEIYLEYGEKPEQYYLVLSTENSTGVQYRVKDYSEVGKKVEEYLKNYQ